MRASLESAFRTMVDRASRSAFTGVAQSSAGVVTGNTVAARSANALSVAFNALGPTIMAVAAVGAAWEQASKLSKEVGAGEITSVLPGMGSGTFSLGDAALDMVFQNRMLYRALGKSKEIAGGVIDSSKTPGFMSETEWAAANQRVRAQRAAEGKPGAAADAAKAGREMAAALKGGGPLAVTVANFPWSDGGPGVNPRGRSGEKP